MAIFDGMAKQATAPARRFLGKLTRGDLGLAKTFWLYGALIIAPIATVVGLIARYVVVGDSPIGGFLTTVSVFLCAGYCLCVLTGTWAAAHRYEGPRAWVILARLAVVFVLMWVTLLLLTFLSAGGDWDRGADSFRSNQTPTWLF